MVMDNDIVGFHTAGGPHCPSVDIVDCNCSYMGRNSKTSAHFTSIWYCRLTDKTRPDAVNFANREILC